MPWFTLNWSTWAFVLAVVVSLIVTARKRAFGLILLGLTLYFGTSWTGWEWVRLGFIIAMFLAVSGYILYRMDIHNRDGFVVTTSFIAAVLGLVLALTSLHTVKVDVPNPFGDVSAMRAALVKMDEDTVARIKAQNAKDSEQDNRLDKLEKQVANHEKRLDALEEKVTGIQSVALADDVDRTRYYDTMSDQMVRAGWKPGDFTIGTVDWDRNAYDAGSRRFVRNTVDSQPKLTDFLSGSSAQSKAARAHVLDVLPDSEHERAMSGRGFVPLQFNTDACLDGNTYFFDARATRDGQRCHSAGDIVWIYVAKSGVVYWDASVRADCGNPGMTVVPYPKGTTKRVTVANPPTPSSTSTTSRPSSTTSTPPPTSTTTLKPKDPSTDGGDSGQNEDPGPGDYVDPTDAGTQQPPDTYTSPPPPPATTTAPPTSTDAPSNPAPEPSAPPTDNPATGCVPAPGESDC